MNELDIKNTAQQLKIKKFRGVFMRDRLPSQCWKNECGVIHLDNNNGPGTHWVGYKKINDSAIYFDSFGNLPPPEEFIDYMGRNVKIYYNYKKYQDFNTVNCGHLCLQFLLKLNKENEII